MFFIFLFLFSCKEDEPTQKKLQISFNESANENSRVLAENAAYVILSIENSSGAKVLTDDEFRVTESNLLEPILLEIGEYSITKFLVFNDADEVIYATPLKGSSLANLVTNPLPIEITVTSDAVTEVNLEVIQTESLDPEDLGYTSNSFSVVPIISILVSVFEENDDQSAHDFTEADLTIFSDGDSVRTILLGDSINIVKLRSDAEEVALQFKHDGRSQIFSFTIDSLNYYRTTPLDVIFNKSSLEEGLVAYYSFNGNAQNQIIDMYHGTSYGADLASDRFGNAAQAYAFNGSGDYISFGSQDPISETGSVSVTLWFYPYDEVSRVPGDTVIKANNQYLLSTGGQTISVGYAAVWNDGTLLSLRKTPHQDAKTEYAGLTESNAWNFYCFTYSADSKTIKMYLNSTLIDEASSEEVDFSNIETRFTVGKPNNEYRNYFNGKIDDIRIYDRVLGTSEVAELASDK